MTMFTVHGEDIAYDAGAGSTIDDGDVTTTANFFHHAGTLAAVGTYTVTDGQKLTVEIRDAALETVLYTQEAQLTYPGYHLVDLETPQEVSDYAIVIRYTGEAPVEGGASFTEKGREWFDLSENVTDEANAPHNACIKAFYAGSAPA